MKYFRRIVFSSKSIVLKAACNLFVLLIIQLTLAQEIKNQVYKDPLKDKSFEELNILSTKASDDSNLELLKIYSDYHLKKAKKENNNLEIARAYYFFISWDNIENDIKYCDSIINITQNSNHRAYPTNGYLLKAHLYYNNSEYNKALDNYITANEWAEIKKYKPLQNEALLGIANIKNVRGLHNEALEIYKAYYTEIINSPDYIVEQYDDYMLMSNNLSLSYIRNHKQDSALMISKLGMKQALLAQDQDLYHELGQVHATANFYSKNYSKALDSLLKFSPFVSGIDLADSYYMIGKIFDYQNNNTLTIKYFKKIDSINHIINDPFPELKEVYNTLFTHAGKIDNKEMQLYYIGKLIETDSILDANYSDIGNKMRKEYDIPMLKKEKQFLKKKLDNKEYSLIIMITALIIVLVFTVHYYLRQKAFKKRLQKLIETDVVKPKISIPDITPLGISDNIISDILNKLENFEQSKVYLSKDITLNSLAKDFNTNSSYLSSVINHVKQINFATYLKDLRITNAINNIKTNNQYLKYSISGLADEFGFTTAESFSRTFRKKTGIMPSYFLNELRKE